MDVLSDPDRFAIVVYDPPPKEEEGLFTDGEYSCIANGAFELYSIQVSDDADDDCETIVIHLKDHLPSDPIYHHNMHQQVGEQKFLTLSGPNIHLTFDAFKFKFHSKSGVISEYFDPERDWDEDKYEDEDEYGGFDRVRTKTIAEKFTVSYAWITRPVRANFQFSFLTADATTITNLKGFIQVSSLKQGTTRTLGLFDNDCIISGETLPLLRTSAAFPAEEPFTVICDLSYLVDGSLKKCMICKTYPSQLNCYGVLTEEELKMAKNDPHLLDRYVIGKEYPKLQMRVFWLTSLMGKYPAF